MWIFGLYCFELLLLVLVMDGVVSLETVGIVGKFGGFVVFNLEGIWMCYEDADEIFERIVFLFKEEVMCEMQEIYQEFVKEHLIM